MHSAEGSEHRLAGPFPLLEAEHTQLPLLQPQRCPTDLPLPSTCMILLQFQESIDRPSHSSSGALMCDAASNTVTHCVWENVPSRERGEIASCGAVKLCILDDARRPSHFLKLNIISSTLGLGLCQASNNAGSFQKLCGCLKKLFRVVMTQGAR
jgi:hypothetical protein